MVFGDSTAGLLLGIISGFGSRSVVFGDSRAGLLLGIISGFGSRSVVFGLGIISGFGSRSVVELIFIAEGMTMVAHVVWDSGLISLTAISGGASGLILLTDISGGLGIFDGFGTVIVGIEDVILVFFTEGIIIGAQVVSTSGSDMGLNLLTGKSGGLDIFIDTVDIVSSSFPVAIAESLRGILG